MHFLLEVRNLTTKFNQYTVHDDISIGFKKGEITVIMGASGSGKTTLVDFIIEGTNGTTSGCLFWEGKEWKRENIAQLIGIAPQNGGFLNEYTVIENIAMPLQYVLGMPTDLAYEISWANMQILGLGSEICHNYPYTLSGGTLRRASIVRALILEQKLLILDEPLSGLDLINTNRIIEVIVNLVPKITIICITHHFIPAQTYMVLNKGKIISGSLEEMEKHPVAKVYFEH